MPKDEDTGVIRQFASGATRDTAEGKLDYEGFFSPIVFQAYAEYMHKHRKQSDGTVRPSDNWQKLFGDDHYAVCMKSLWRHMMDLWMYQRGYKPRETVDDALAGIMFNTMAYWLKILKEREAATRTTIDPVMFTKAISPALNFSKVLNEAYIRVQKSEKKQKRKKKKTYKGQKQVIRL